MPTTNEEYINIRVSKKVRAMLEHLKLFKRETLDTVIERLIMMVESKFSSGEILEKK